MNDTAVFLRESYQRIGVWEEMTHNTHHRCLSFVGEMRWWAKDAALGKMFGSFGAPENSLYVDLVMTLTTITEKDKMKPSVRVRAKAYMEALLKYETVLTAQIFLRIFELMSPLSKYLQTTGMNIVTAHRLGTGTQENLRKYARDFESVQRSADMGKRQTAK